MTKLSKAEKAGSGEIGTQKIERYHDSEHKKRKRGRIALLTQAYYDIRKEMMTYNEEGEYELRALDPEGTIENVDPSYCLMFGWMPEPAYVQNILDNTHTINSASSDGYKSTHSN